MVFVISIENVFPMTNVPANEADPENASDTIDKTKEKSKETVSTESPDNTKVNIEEVPEHRAEVHVIIERGIDEGQSDILEKSFELSDKDLQTTATQPNVLSEDTIDELKENMPLLKIGNYKIIYSCNSPLLFLGIVSLNLNSYNYYGLYYIHRKRLSHDKCTAK